MEITNKAYNHIEIGNEGLAFRFANTFRFRNLAEAAADVNYFYVLKNDEADIVGAVMAKINRTLDMVSIGSSNPQLIVDLYVSELTLLLESIFYKIQFDFC